ncbi:MAG: MBL fold metallo-hydrolase, partial [Acidobacteria bacterium]|nr:MBL fold metallo-hydrolase [Acidobacteriota bacterium]
MSENAPAIEVSKGIWLIKLPLPFPVAAINVYLVRGEDGFLLLDCGLKTKACRETLAEALALVGIGWGDIRQLVITHLHPDHFGLAAEVRRLSGAEVLMHPAEAVLMSPRYLDHDFFARHSGWLAENGVPADETEEISCASVGIAEFIEMVEVDRPLGDGDRLRVKGGELEVLWSPGHSPGLLTFYFPQRKLYFSSDHMVEKITPNIGLHSHSAENPLDDYLASLDRLRAKEIDLVLPSHGHPFRGHREWIAATQEHHQARCGQMLATV